LASFTVRPLTASDLASAEALLDTRLAGRHQARRGELIDVLALPGLVAVDASEDVIGVLSYQRTADACELVALAAQDRHTGTGTTLLNALLDLLRREAATQPCSRLWLITTNDNLDALRFYQRRGFVMRAVYPGAVNASRRLKPQIPPSGAYGIPLRDELELELPLES
jgi:GNAT superfamily N-acetyltransferase